ncbi:hypothetical protein DE146DRAFT_771008 [Phaeosphaeria sp. MPI-PUGE-AT-0046c]|nr:hypothetical protein DE146DRAFT_771008 [Phaeosphaeria sp. MPI-PUGE-AT-0046c]
MRFQDHGLITSTIVVVILIAKIRADCSLNAALYTRETSTPGFVDPVTVPACFFNTCWHYSSPPPEICPLVNGPCLNNSDATDNGGTKCGMKLYTRDCYCNLKTGLHCAWSCSWTSWWDTEDWYAKLCPQSPALRLDFSGLPKCARQCLDDAIFEYGCLTQSSNCFCARGNLFKCHENSCSAGDWKKIEDWLQYACDLDATKAKLAVEQGTFTIGDETGAGAATATATRVSGPPSRKPQQPPTWDEIFIFVILALTILGGLGLWIYSCAAGRQRHTWRTSAES